LVANPLVHLSEYSRRNPNTLLANAARIRRPAFTYETAQLRGDYILNIAVAANSLAMIQLQPVAYFPVNEHDLRQLAEEQKAATTPTKSSSSAAQDLEEPTGTTSGQTIILASAYYPSPGKSPLNLSKKEAEATPTLLTPDKLRALSATITHKEAPMAHGAQAFLLLKVRKTLERSTLWAYADTGTLEDEKSREVRNGLWTMALDGLPLEFSDHLKEGDLGSVISNLPEQRRTTG